MATIIRKTAGDAYMKLITQFPLRRIKNASEHAKAKKIMLRLSIERGNRGATEYRDVLIDLIADYEKRAGQIIESNLSAAELIQHRIEERGMSVSALARLIGVPQSNLSEMLNGKRDWSKAAIRGLSAQMNIGVERFLL